VTVLVAEDDARYALLGTASQLWGQFLKLAIGTKYELVRRPSTISLVMPSSVNRK
jgi:hypothetical protein